MAALFTIFQLDGCPSWRLTLDIADPLFALVIAPGFYPHHVEEVVADQDQASGSL